MKYDITQLSQEDMQIMGDVMAKTCKRVARKIEYEEGNLEYQRSHGRGLNDLIKLSEDKEWDEAAEKTEEKLTYLRQRLADAERITKLITVN